MKNNRLFCIMLLIVACTIAACLQVQQIEETPTKIVVNQPPISPSPTKSEPTPTLIPTFTADQRLLQVKKWLINNANCKLPCWWGIEPGKVTWDEVKEFLDGIGAKSGMYKENGVIIYETGGFDFNQEHVFNRVSFVETNALISAIIVKGSGFNDSPNFKNLWETFSPENIIMEYGVPSRIWVYSRSSVHEGTPGPTMPYSLWIFYDYLGILVRYDGQVQFENIYKMCPVFSEQGNLSDYIYFYLQSPDANTPIESLTDVKYYGRKPISIEEAAGIDPHDFYEIITQQNIAPCFETPRGIWP